MGSVLRFENLTPETYVNQSRDFQMMCRLLNIAFNSSMRDSDTLRYLNSPEYCPSNQLKRLSHKLGFDYTAIIYDDELRKILISFKKLVSYKGSLKGINEAIQLFMNIKHKYFDYSIEVRGNTLQIMVMSQVIEDFSILTDILKYIIPCGYSFKYIFARELPIQLEPIDSAQKISAKLINNINNTLVQINSPEGGELKYVEDANNSTSTLDELINGFNTMQVVSNKDVNDFAESDNEHNAILLNIADNDNL